MPRTASLSAALLLGLAMPSLAQAGQLLSLHEMASVSDPAVAAARAQAEAEKAQAGVFRANLLPTLGATGAVTRSRDETSNSNFVGFEDTLTYSTNYSYGVQLSQPLFDAAAFARYAQVDDQLALAMAGSQIAEQELILRVATQYFDWLAAQDNLRFAQAELAAIRRALEQAEVRYEVGLAAITDKQEAQARFDLARATELSAAAQLRSRTQALRALTGSVPDKAYVLGEMALQDAPAPGNPEPWVERALSDNLELLRADKQAEIARLEKNVARAGHYPTLDLVAEHSFSDTSDAQLGRESTTDQASLRLNLPLFSGGATRARHKQAAANHLAAEAQAESTRRDVEQRTRDAYDGVVTGAASVSALQQAVRSANTARDAVQAGVEVGTRTNVDLLDAERELFRARRDLARARYDYLLNVLQLERAVGSLDLQDLGRIDALLNPS
ncbi:MAG: TolC family outer membrane protein [Oceanococcaceae bacterium]